MKYSFVLSGLLATVTAHGVITQIQGANGVKMPGLSVVDGTPRDCATPACGAEADTSIIRSKEAGTAKASALGRNKSGPIDADKAIASFMGGSGASTASTSNSNSNTNANSNSNANSNTNANSNSNTNANTKEKRAGILGSLLGGGKGAASGGATSQGTKTAKGTTEQGVAAAAGSGAQSGLPTTADDGTITMTFHQVNQDGAGPLTAQVDATSGGKDPSAFKDAQVTSNVPGIGIGGLSAATTTDFPIKVQMPAGMTCSGSAGGASNLCIVRLQNSALAGPFGGSAAFTQSAGAKKRAIEYNLRKRHMARGILGKPDLE